jgi:hypothetical protein
MKMNRAVRALCRALVTGCAGVVLGAVSAGAQTTTGSVRGTISGAAGEPVEGAQILARNIDFATERGVVTGANGFYNLAGLRPGRYALTIRRIGFGAQTDTMNVGIGQTISRNYTLSPATAELSTVMVVAAPPAAETRTSEIATNVSEEQIEQLPTASRNFLDLAALAPGTTVSGDRLNSTDKTFSAGAQGPNQVNIFVDGATYKNDILKGGTAGQNTSRGNPFPRSAVQEYRVLTQNYKAEYQKASSAIITATTKSGGPTWEGSVFFEALNEGWVALDTFQLRDRRNNPTGFREPELSRYQYGISGGGPIIDRLRFFGALEIGRQDRSERVNIPPPTPGEFPALDTVNFAQYNGSFPSPFRSTLGFGKLTFLHRDNSTFDLSYSTRLEEDVRDFGGLTTYESAKNFRNTVNTGILKHNFATGAMVNEATFSFQRFQYNPTQRDSSRVNRLFGYGCCAVIGGNTTSQDFKQNRFSLRNDLTYSGFAWAGQHVVKGGANVDFLTYDVLKQNDENPRFIYEPWFGGFATPHRVEFQSGDPNFDDKNTQLGAYIQDDWSPTSRLTLNLGVRWDMETGMMNLDYVTPQNVVDTLRKYEDRLFLTLDEDRYFTDGNDRKRYMGAIQPRVGASYSVDRNGRTTVFGGWGIYVDRHIYDLAAEERFALQHPKYTVFFNQFGQAPTGNQIQFEERYLTEGKAALDELIASQRGANPEIKLLPNDLRPPMSQQFTAGVRQLFGNFAIEAAYTGVRSKNVATFYWANENFVCPVRARGFPDCFVHNDIPGFANVLFLDDQGKTWYDALALKVDRPYQQVDRFGWGAGLAYTLAARYTQGFNDEFSFANAADYPKQRRNDERHRIVSHFITDMPYLWGIQASGILTLGSGQRYDIGFRDTCIRTDPDVATSCTIRSFEAGAGEPERHAFLFAVPRLWAYRNLDLRVRKDFVAVGNNRLGITVDVFNVFNSQNLGCYTSEFNRSSPNFGTAGCVISDARRLQLGTQYDF